MSDQEINEAIAKATGWVCSERGWWSHPTLPDNGGAEPFPPDYCIDLNAMHEAEKVLSLGKGYNQLKGFGLYKTALAEVCDEQHPIDATARQRAEAFLRTIGKWKEAAK